tara:strand:- start:6172 stop:7185 length:1014 start_codon:yes stop_codon:yes gene_type:complete
MLNVLITGGSGFIGTNLLLYLLDKYPNYKFYNLDLHTYASNKFILSKKFSFKNYKLLVGDVNNYRFIVEIFRKYNIDKVIHLAAESHVDKSIDNPFIFAKTNVMGTLNLLHASLISWRENYKEKLFYHISSDEVFGSLEENENSFSEDSRYNPNSPYSASKASSDHFVRAYGRTYGFPYIISNSSNNYGPYQYPEKIIPLFISNIINQKELPIYGDGTNVRDWIHVNDHVKAIDLIFHHGKNNSTYLVGGENEVRNIDLACTLIKYTDKLMGRKKGFSNRLIKFVKNRKGHDFRYSVDISKLKNELAWAPEIKFDIGIKETINWYIKNTKKQFKQKN